jgi:hypothetical protein
VPSRRRVGGGRFLAGLAGAAIGIGLLASCSSTTATANPRVLLVGSFHGRAGQYQTIQSAVDAAGPGDFILIGPGDYHPDTDLLHPPTAAAASLGAFGGVLVHTKGIYIRGMNRNSVIIDGTKPGAPTPCDSAPQWQQLGSPDGKGGYYGRNGIVAYRADNVWIENLTVCNFLSGTGASGNEVWWDGGNATGKIGMTGYRGDYLTATSTYYGNPAVAATYGIFANNAAGPASWNHIYASNFDDSGMYVGACQQVCDVTIDHAWMEYNALGYSGTNSGGAIVIEDSQFDHNQDGFDTNTQILGDPPPPQNGDCPGGAISPITHTRSCWVFMHNDVHDNNNGNAPLAPGGYAAAGPVGTGMTVSGGRNDTVMDNTFSNNGAWGVLFVPFPDSDKPFPGITCAGSGGVQMSGLGCVYEPEGDALIGNSFVHNGFFANPTNGDFGELTLAAGVPQNCFRANVAPDGSAPPNLEQLQPRCGPITKATQSGGALLGQVACDAGLLPCPAGANYPKPSTTAVVMHPRPGGLPSMPDPCQGVPDNAWCKNGAPV